MKIEYVADKRSRDIQVTGLNSALVEYTAEMTVLRFSTETIKARGHFNRIGIAPTDTPIEPGDILTLPDGNKYITISKVPDYYRGKPIRYTLELAYCNTLATFQRVSYIKDDVGRVQQSTLTPIWTNIPVSYYVSDEFSKSEKMIVLTYINVEVSVHYHNVVPIKINDRVSLLGSEYEVRYIKMDFPGVVQFRIEPVRE